MNKIKINNIIIIKKDIQLWLKVIKKMNLKSSKICHFFYSMKHSSQESLGGIFSFFIFFRGPKMGKKNEF